MVKAKKSDCATQQNEKEPRKDTNGSGSTEKVTTSESTAKKNNTRKKYQAKIKKKVKQAMKRKAQKKQKVDGVEEADSADSTPSQQAIDYLHKWQNDRDSWTFKKVRQVWLLKHIYDDSLVPKDDFNILLEYLKGLKGQGRDATIEEAKTVMENYEKQKESEAAGQVTFTNQVSDGKYERAQNIMQTL